VIIESLLSNSQWNKLIDKHRLDPDPNSCKTDLISIRHQSVLQESASEYLERISAQYPSFMGDRSHLYHSRAALFQVNYALLRPDSHSVYSCQGQELPLTYSSYQHYLTSKTLWRAGHSDACNIPIADVTTYRSKRTCAEEIKGISLLLASHADHNNYWHWTFDCISRLIVMQHESPDHFTSVNNIVILAPAGHQHFQLEYLDAFRHLFPEKRVVVSSNSLICETLYVYNPPTPLIHCRDQLSQLRHGIANLFDIQLNASATPIKLYIRRRGLAKNGRLLENENDVCSNLEKYGFISVDPASLGVRDQLDLFASSEIVAGVHGSGFVNILTMAPSSKVIELLGETYAPVHDKILASQLNLAYYEIYLGLTGLESRSNYTCDPNALVESILDISIK
jgi:capsular polysaccharide biosynthesis protein